MDPVYELKFLFFLIFTLVIEIPALVLCVRLIRKKEEPTLSLFLIICVGFLASFATLPYVWFVLPAFIQIYLYYMIAAEVFAFGMEGLIYTFLLKLPFHRAMLFSLICNALSFLGGEGVKAFGGFF
jgi:hypothetical protein